ncbi:aromatic amino acid exporter YddG [Frigidibacter sp. ROC022]|uniref:aromatic amino acid exporter YddG n=1 Tax=Frigidibacter sp. ROC022 TaxID=2971796 RepID=UPI00215A687C|nr:EamA family transporter [Frigidibacter sp. ROC022]MCR8724911.1 EamA family transporter [Frigidibacter sp. ROC022]
MNRRTATYLGFGAVLLWALLALFTVATRPVPPFQLNAMSFAVAGLAGLVWCWARGRLGVLRRVPLRVLGFGTLGLFAYHALYFSALRLAPPAEASLIAYLWPLFIVLFSGLLLKEPLRLGHLVGAVMGLAGAGLVMSGGVGFSSAHLPGYGLAFLCALTWSLYSVLSRRLGAVPTEAVTLFCIATAILSVPLHLAMEETAWPTMATGWLGVAGLGLGPVGLAFFLWDLGVKRGDIRLLGTASYAAPVLSTLILVATGFTPASPRILISVLLITGGALVAIRASAAEASDGSV